uniref:SFRICE_024101 n=1 Tax=Spodoptera frugiperda TaxID=7108 RepID=A0A2H1X2M3_SPOFR
MEVKFRDQTNISSHIHYAATPQIFIEDKYLQSKIIRTKDNKVCVEEENLQKIGLAFNRLRPYSGTKPNYLHCIVIVGQAKTTVQRFKDGTFERQRKYNIKNVCLLSGSPLVKVIYVTICEVSERVPQATTSTRGKSILAPTSPALGEAREANSY